MIHAIIEAFLALINFLAQVVMAVMSLIPVPTDILNLVLPSGGVVEQALDVFNAVGFCTAVNIIFLAYMYRLAVRLILFFISL